MSSNFESVIKQVISGHHMESLSDSAGWPKIRDIRRRLDSGSITPEQAIDAFLGLRDSYRSKRNDREFKKEIVKMLTH